MSSSRTTLFDAGERRQTVLDLPGVEQAEQTLITQATQLPSGIWRNLSYGAPKLHTPKNADAAYDWVAGYVRSYLPRRTLILRRAARIVALQPRYEALNDTELREQAIRSREVFRRGRARAADVDEAFAVVREVAWRTVGMRPYPVQVAAAVAMELGHVAELATGEGKTLSATMPATLAGWRGRGCHVVTVNDYLAQRDAEHMKPVYEFCGLSVGHVTQEMDPPARRAAYGCDVTYLTNKEAAADFLRDGLSRGPKGTLQGTLLGQILGTARRGGGSNTVMRGLECAIVDEADSVLIDEAVTPLIISGEAPNDELNKAIVQAVALGGPLQRGEHYTIDERYREVRLTRRGREHLAALTVNMGGVWAGARRREELVTQAVTARELYHNGRQYVVVDGKVAIVDEFTGRLMADRSWRDGLHQAVEAKENLEITPPKDTLARVSFQRFFRLYNKLSGMTGTAAEAAGELWAVYKKHVVKIPTHRPCIRRQHPDRIFATEASKWEALIAHVEEVHRSGQPILLGTRSVQASELVSRMLTERGMEHEVLNAVRHAEEAKVVGRAGEKGRITVATNMAGRGTDIKLERGVADLGGLHVVASECHESTRIDRQLFGRAGRQGDPGSAVLFVSFQDEVLLRYASPYTRDLLQRVGGNRAGEITSPLTRALIGYCRARAGRISLSQRKAVLRTDDWLAENMGFTGEPG